MVGQGKYLVLSLSKHFHFNFVYKTRLIVMRTNPHYFAVERVVIVVVIGKFPRYGYLTVWQHLGALGMVSPLSA